MPIKKTAARRNTKLKDMPQSPALLAEQAVNLLLSIPEIQEAFTRADLELALDDQGWESFLGANQDLTTEQTSVQRRRAVTTSRRYWQRDPLAKQSVRLWTDYAFGNGMTYKADEGAQQKLDSFCKHRLNKHIMRASGQQRSSRKLLVDGEVFFAIFTGDGDQKFIRYIDPLQMTDLITDPDDDERVIAYRRKTSNDKLLYYKDWRNDEEADALAEAQKDPETKGAIKLEEDVVIYHAPFDNIGKRGNGLLVPAIDWSREHRRFMESRVALTQALAKYAFKITAKGGPNAVSNIAKQLTSTIRDNGLSAGERNPPSAPASTFVKNSGLELEAMPRTTGASDAEADGNGLKLMVSAATGIMLHYFGDPSTGNLATSTAMELPMLKMFNSYQQFWIEVYQDIFSIVLGEDIDEDPLDVDVDMPPILQDDLQKLGAFMTQLTTAFPETKVPDIIKLMLTAIGVCDLDDVMKAIAAEKVNVDKKAADETALAHKNNLELTAAKQKPITEAEQLAAVKELTEALRFTGVRA